MGEATRVEKTVHRDGPAEAEPRASPISGDFTQVFAVIEVPKIGELVESKQKCRKTRGTQVPVISGFSGPASVAFTEDLVRSMPSGCLHCQGRWLELMLHNHSSDAPSIRCMLASILSFHRPRASIHR